MDFLEVPAIISKKIESIVRCISRIEEKRPAELELLEKNYDLQDIISVNLERAVQLSVDIAAIIISEKGLKTQDTMSGAFEELERAGILSAPLSIKMQKAVGFRNLSVHHYNAVDWALVFDIIHKHLNNFRDYIKVVYGVLQ